MVTMDLEFKECCHPVMYFNFICVRFSPFASSIQVKSTIQCIETEFTRAYKIFLPIVWFIFYFSPRKEYRFYLQHVNTISSLFSPIECCNERRYSLFTALNLPQYVDMSALPIIPFSYSH